MKYELKFKNSKGEFTSLGICNDLEEVWTVIEAFLKEKNYVSYYYRTIYREDYLWIDVGSHSEFFYAYYLDKE